MKSIEKRQITRSAPLSPTAQLSLYGQTFNSLKHHYSHVGGGLSGGNWALFRFELPACYHLNLGIFWGDWLFQIFFFVKNKTLPWSNHFLKIQWKVHFLSFLNTDRNAPKKKFRIEIWTFSFQICFKNQFSTSGSGHTENTCIREYVYFQFDHFPKSKIYFESIFEMRMAIFLF